MNYVYILANKPHGTLYIGITSNLVKRVYQHKHNSAVGFTQKYAIHTLVYYEEAKDVLVAIQREKTLKKWKRAWKVALIEASNPQWDDLYQSII